MGRVSLPAIVSESVATGTLGLTEIVDQTGKLHPIRLSILTDRLGSLEQVLDLRKRSVGVTVVDQGW